MGKVDRKCLKNVKVEELQHNLLEVDEDKKKNKVVDERPKTNCGRLRDEPYRPIL